MPEILVDVAAGIGAADLTVYLVDFGQTTLEPIPPRWSRDSSPPNEPVATSMAGRAFPEQAIVTAERDGGTRSGPRWPKARTARACWRSPCRRSPTTWPRRARSSAFSRAT